MHKTIFCITSQILNSQMSVLPTLYLFVVICKPVSVILIIAVGGPLGHVKNVLVVTTETHEMHVGDFRLKASFLQSNDRQLKRCICCFPSRPPEGSHDPSERGNLATEEYPSVL